MSKWEPIDDFLSEHKSLIQMIWEIIDDEDYESLSEYSYEIWSKTRSKVNRSPITHCFDCIYIVANCTGKKVSVSYLKYIGQMTLGRGVKAMDSLGRIEDRWFVQDWARDIIIDVIGDEELYQDCVAWWMRDEEE